MSVDFKKIILRNGKKSELDSSILSVAEPVFIADSGEIAIKKSDGTLSVFGENIVDLSRITSSTKLKDYTDVNKTYVLFTTNGSALSSELQLTGEITRCIMNNYIANGSQFQILKIFAGNTADMNKVFLRFLSNGTQATFIDITIPDNYITKTKLSSDLQADIDGKVDQSVIEQGVAPITIEGHTKDDFYALNCRYQTVGDYCYITFTSNPKVAIDSPLVFKGLPFVAYNTSILAAYTGKGNPIKIEITNNTSTLTVTKISGEAFLPGETTTFSIGHRIKS